MASVHSGLKAGGDEGRAHGWVCGLTMGWQWEAQTVTVHVDLQDKPLGEVTSLDATKGGHCVSIEQGSALLQRYRMKRKLGIE